MSLPKEINYIARPQSLPVGTNVTSIVASPTNGSLFTDGAVIYLDMVNRGYLVPSSLYLRYKLTSTITTGQSYIRGIPAYAPFARSEVLIGSSVVESIQQYNQVCNMIVNTKLNVAQKVGLASAFGILDQTTTPTFANTNGANLGAVAGSFALSLACPLGNMLSCATTLVPLGKMPATRVQLTLDSVANVISGTGTGIRVENVELCYDVVEFGPEVDAAVDSMVDENGEIIIKSQGFINSAQVLTSGFSGMNELVYGVRLASIKSLFASFCGTTAAHSPSSWSGSRDITSSNGDYQFSISGRPFPERPISTTLNKAGALMELLGAHGPAHDLLTSNTCITPIQFFAYLGSNGAATPDTVTLPSQFWVGVNTEKLSSNTILLSGVSSQNTPITLRVNTSTATTQGFNVNVIAMFDALIKINPRTRQASVMI